MPKPSRQLDLLRDWTPQPATVRFEDGAVRAATIEQQISRAVSAALRDCEIQRPEIARRMSEFLGAPMPVNTLNLYASQARDDHVITLPRFVALMHATRDRRLLELLAELLGWAVIDRRHLPLIDLAQVQEKQRELRQQAEALRRRVGGLVP